MLSLSKILGMRKESPLPWEQPFDRRATETDIRACFRLILGRNPNREEWAGHSARAGEDLSSVVASYVSSLEFSRRNLLAWTAGDTKLARLPEFSIYAAPDDLAVGRTVLGGSYEPEITATFRRILRPGMGAVDIGANIGWFTMLAAALVGPTGFVLAVEPNPRNVKLLEASRRLNAFGQVVVAQLAAGREVGVLVLHTSHSNGTTSPLPKDMAALLNAETIPCLPLDVLLPEERRIDLIKIDVEGAEYNALLGCRKTIARWRPAIVSEFSPGSMPGISGISGEEYLRFLIDLGYHLWVVEHDASLRAFRQDIAGVMTVWHDRAVDHIDIVAAIEGHPAI